MRDNEDREDWELDLSLDPHSPLQLSPWRRFPLLLALNLILPPLTLVTSLLLFAPSPPLELVHFGALLNLELHQVDQLPQQKAGSKEASSPPSQEAQSTKKDHTTSPDPYPWVSHTLRPLSPKIALHLHNFTQDHFYCRGAPHHSFKEAPPKESEQKGSYRVDCYGGRLGHSLPYRNGSPWFSPLIIDLCSTLSQSPAYIEIQEGHCCPTHLRYIDPHHRKTDRHLCGAATTLTLFVSARNSQELQKLLQEAIERASPKSLKKKPSSTLEPLPEEKLFAPYEEGAQNDLFIFQWKKLPQREDSKEKVSQRAISELLKGHWQLRIEARRETWQSKRAMPFDWEAYKSVKNH